MFDVELPLILMTPNIQEHWTKRHKRNKRNSIVLQSIKVSLQSNLKLPCKVVITRYSSRIFDYDNYVFSLKFIRDELSSYIIPGLARGQADSSEHIEWEYKQEKSKEKKVRIEIKGI